MKKSSLPSRRQPLARSKRAMPWNMCRTCHREGTPRRWSILKCPVHPLMPVGECGQCGKRRPLVNCHAYDFRKPIPKVNPRRRAKRKAGYRKMLSGKEYKAARTEAMERAGDRCEQVTVFEVTYKSGDGEYQMANSYVQSLGGAYVRCENTEDLHAHHLRYPKSRPLEATDLKIVCKPHHEYLESLKMHKQRMF